MNIPGLQSFTQNSMWVLNGLKDDAIYLTNKCAKIFDKQFKFKTEKFLDKLFFDYQPYGKMTESDVNAALNIGSGSKAESLKKQFNTMLKTDQFVKALSLFVKNSVNQTDSHLSTLQKNVLGLVEKQASRFSLFTILSTSKEQAAIVEFCREERTSPYTEEGISLLSQKILNSALQKA